MVIGVICHLTALSHHTTDHFAILWNIGPYHKESGSAPILS